MLARMQRRGNTYTLLVGVQINLLIVETGVMILQRDKNGTTIQPRNLITIYPKEYKSFYHKDICMGMFITAQFIIARTWTQPKCP